MGAGMLAPARTQHPPLAPRRALTPTRARWQALGTSAELLVLGDATQLATARAIVERELREIDRACSRFRADSELSRINACAGGRPVGADALLVEAVTVALRAARASDGCVDPTVGRALELVGYDRDWSLLEPAPPEHDASPTTAEHETSLATSGHDASPMTAKRGTPALSRVHVRAVPGWRRVRVDGSACTLSVPRGVKLDLGATAKAWAADRAAAAAHAATGVGVLVSLGGDIATAGEPPTGGWRVHVTDNHRAGPDAPGQTIAIGGGGLATSSTAVRRWKHRGSTMHHILDPSTGKPASTPWRTVSVAASDCVDANTAATAALVRGADAPQWLAGLGLPARLQGNDGVVVMVGGWPGEEGSQRLTSASAMETQPGRAHTACAQVGSREMAA